MLCQIILAQPAAGCDRPRHVAAVERLRAVLGDPAERPLEVGQAVDRSDGRNRPRRDVGQCPEIGDPLREADTPGCEVGGGGKGLIEPEPPERSARSAQPRTAPGTVTEVGPVAATRVVLITPGERPEAFRPKSAPSFQIIANISPPRPFVSARKRSRQGRLPVPRRPRCLLARERADRPGWRPGGWSQPCRSPQSPTNAASPNSAPLEQARPWQCTVTGWTQGEKRSRLRLRKHRVASPGA